ncbi:MAG: VWA domain-containing protein, partial [Pirellulales bacterium]|nr:VWA domain-containing protein [Pirellulales bacterium]
MNGTLPEWIQRLLGIEAGPGEGAAWQLQHTWPWAPWASLLLVVFVVGFVAAVYLHEGRRAGFRLKVSLASIRVALIGIVLLMIAQFTLSVERTGLPYLALIVDDSASMTIVDRYEKHRAGSLAQRLEATGFEPAQPSRENLAKLLLVEKRAQWLRRFADDYKLRFYSLRGARQDQPTNLDQLTNKIRQIQADGPTTRLGTTLGRVLDDLRGTTPAGIVLLTDGINTEGPGLDWAAARARKRGVPLFLVGLGNDRPVADLKLTDLLVDEVVFVDDVVYFEAVLSATGYGGRELRVTLRRDGRPDVLAETRVTANPDGRPQTVRLPYRPDETGPFRWTVEIEPLQGELQTENNHLTRTMEVRKEQIRVLLVQDYPNFEYRYLRKMLGRDNTIRLDTLLQEADLAHAEQDAAALPVFPVRRDELSKYDVIILGDVDFKRLGQSAMENLASLVNRPVGGGALVFIAGPEFNPVALRDTPLERFLPIALGSVWLPHPDTALLDGFVVQPTELGLNNPAMQLGDDPTQTKALWASLPPLYWMIDAPELKPGVVVLAVNPNRMNGAGQPLPVICMQYVGAGKVLMHMTDETWRWRRRAGDRYFARYWIQMIRYLARSKLTDNDRQAVLTTDRREYRQGEMIRFRLRLADPRFRPDGNQDVVLMVEQEGQRTQRVVMSRHAVHETFEGTLLGAIPGGYHAWIAS